MTTADQSKALSEADSSTFGHPEGSSDTEPVPILGETDRNSPSLDLMLSVVESSMREDGREGRVLYRLLLTILLLVVGILLDARRIGDAASFMLL